MIIGCLQLPNKWARTANITGTPYLYANMSSFPNTNADSWGDVITVFESTKLYKVIAQFGYRVTEYWCVQIDKLPFAQPSPNDRLLFPIAMKRFGYKNSEAKFFVFQQPIFSLLYLCNDSFPKLYYPNATTTLNMLNWHANGIKSSPGEYLYMGLSEGEPWGDYSKMYWNIQQRGEDQLLFPSGATITIGEVLHRCANVLNYGSRIIYQFDECNTPHDLGITTESDILAFLLDYTPVTLGTKYLELDPIGEQILKQNMVTFPIDALNTLIMHSPSSVNTMKMLQDASCKEELINVENLTASTIRDVYPLNDSTIDSVQEDIDEMITSLCRDEATTIVLSYDYANCKLNEIERILGYGYASYENSHGTKSFNTSDQISFTLHNLCEIIQARQIRLIKTYNEELFLTVWYDNGKVESYYYNLILHACVTGALFTL